MGSDLHMNPPAPPPLWEQVKGLQDRVAAQTETIRQLQAENRHLSAQHDQDTQLLANAMRIPIP